MFTMKLGGSLTAKVSVRFQEIVNRHIILKVTSIVHGIASNHNKDLTYDLLEQHSGSLKMFVRNVSFDDSVTCVLCNLKILNDFVEIECLLLRDSFNLGDFYVTVTTYENLLIVSRKTGKQCLCT